MKNHFFHIHLALRRNSCPGGIFSTLPKQRSWLNCVQRICASPLHQEAADKVDALSNDTVARRIQHMSEDFKETRLSEKCWNEKDLLCCDMKQKTYLESLSSRSMPDTCVMMTSMRNFFSLISCEHPKGGVLDTRPKDFRLNLHRWAREHRDVDLGLQLMYLKWCPM